MRTLLQTFAEAGRTVFVSSHILPEIQQIADQIAIIARGRLVRSGPLDRLLHESGHVRIRVGPDEVTRAAELLSHVTTDVQLDDQGPGWLSVAAAPTRAAELNRALVAAGVDVSGLEVGSDLEALFLSLTREV